ncbi:MAG: hypothetical protein RL065_316 [Bacteroidota bacterium]|jgi:hypothetical protein
MKTANFNIPLNFNQIFELVKQLPMKEKIKLSKELEKDTLDKKLTSLLQSFKTDELSQSTIDKEVEAVRAELYGSKK